MVTGATGFIGGRLSRSLARSGVQVRCLVRDRARSGRLEREGCELHEGVLEYLRRAPEVSESEGREVQIGGPDVLSYGDMLDRMAVAMGMRPRRKLPVPFVTPWLSSLWLGLVTPVDTTVARSLVEGLTTATIVTDPSGASAFEIAPSPLTRYCGGA